MYLCVLFFWGGAGFHFVARGGGNLFLFWRGLLRVFPLTSCFELLVFGRAGGPLSTSRALKQRVLLVPWREIQWGFVRTLPLSEAQHFIGGPGQDPSRKMSATWFGTAGLPVSMSSMLLPCKCSHEGLGWASLRYQFAFCLHQIHQSTRTLIGLGTFARAHYIPRPNPE